MIKKKSICVFCGSNENIPKDYKNFAKNLGKKIANHNYRLVYGGGNLGLMGILSQSVIDSEGEILGISPISFLKNKKILISQKNHILTENMHERKKKMFDESDIFLIIPGGVGTLDEFFEILTLAQLRIHKKKIILINFDNYWESLVELLKHMIKKKFLNDNIFNYFKTVNNIDEAFNLILEEN